MAYPQDPKYTGINVTKDLKITRTFTREQIITIVSIVAAAIGSGVYFRHIRWSVKWKCPRCGYRNLYSLLDCRYGCKRCSNKFGEFTGTYIGEFNFSLDILAHFMYQFAFGVPA